MEMTWTEAFPNGRDEDDPKVTCRQYNETQSTSVHDRGVARQWKRVLSRTASLHPDDDSIIALMFRTMEERAI